MQHDVTYSTSNIHLSQLCHLGNIADIFPTALRTERAEMYRGGGCYLLLISAEKLRIVNLP